MDCCKTITIAIKNDHKDCLRTLYKNSKRINSYTCETIVRHNSINCLKYVIKKGIYQRDPYNDSRLCHTALYYNNLECFKYLFRLNFTPLESQSYYSSLRNTNKTECLDYLFKKGVEIPDDFIKHCVGTNNLKLIRHMYSNDMPLKRLCYWAAYCNKMDILKFALSKGLECEADATQIAARHGALQILKYLITNGCPYTDNECRIIQNNGNYYCILYYVLNNIGLSECKLLGPEFDGKLNFD